MQPAYSLHKICDAQIMKNHTIKDNFNVFEKILQSSFMLMYYKISSIRIKSNTGDIQ
jgi:hypothetical protein